MIRMLNSLLIAVVAATVTLVSMASAQPRIQISMHSEYVANSEVRSLDVCAYSNGDMIQLFSKYPSESQVELWAQKTDSDGNQLWLQPIHLLEPDLVVQSPRVKVFPNGDAIIGWVVSEQEVDHPNPVGMHFARISSQGSIAWMQTAGYGYPGRKKKIDDIYLINDHEAMVVAWMEAYSPWVDGIFVSYSINLDGTVSNYISYDIPYEHLVDADMRDDLLYFLTRNREYHRDEISVVVCDLQGNIIWSQLIQNDYHVYSYSISARSDGAAYVTEAGDDLPVRLKAVGIDGELWSTEFSVNAGGFERTFVKSLSSDTALIWATNLNLKLFNSDGSLLWSEDSHWNDTRFYRHPIRLYSENEIVLGHEMVPESVAITRYRFSNNEQTTQLVPKLTTISTPAFPNPFNASTTIQLQMPHSGDVGITITDVLGRQVDRWTVSATGSGVVPVSWTPNGLASGIYFLNVIAPDGIRAMQKVTLVR
jgi:Secretion system C-terminal sorting domain